MSIVITLQDYFTCDGVDCRADLSPDLIDNGVETLDRINELLFRYERFALVLYHVAPVTFLNSGYRTLAKNKSLPNAARNSPHMRARAGDLDDPDGLLDDYAMNHIEVLEEIGLWLEHPAATKGWCHVQTISPRSGRRIFYP